jgi:hypothetical protein
MGLAGRLERNERRCGLAEEAPLPLAPRPWTISKGGFEIGWGIALPPSPSWHGKMKILRPHGDGALSRLKHGFKIP